MNDVGWVQARDLADGRILFSTSPGERWRIVDVGDVVRIGRDGQIEAWPLH